MTMHPGPYLAACVDQARIDGADLPAAVQQAFRDTISHLFTDAVADDALHRWNAEHAGNSLIAYLSADGSVAELHEMPSNHAAAVANENPDRTLIVATWPAVTS